MGLAQVRASADSRASPGRNLAGLGGKPVAVLANSPINTLK
jgi:hypothetical protein